jgi:hypothetical protein
MRFDAFLPWRYEKTPVMKTTPARTQPSARFS